ncbi:DUF4097 family beta strand repeat-containing protein [Nonomuraea sp. NPDC050310]|uniref:DUF4097 family beta strand repeat-containing protein n=1 Tax=Nonomuraea sp. NPDC050310 TaxID=3154935 RepID=UPI0033F8F4AF
MKKTFAIAGALAAGVLLTGCGIGDLVGSRNQEQVSYDVTDKVAKLTVDSGAGDIVVNESDRTGIRVTETLHWRSGKPRTAHEVGGGGLSLNYNCPDTFGDCGVDYRIEVPKGMALQLATDAGNVTLRAVSGAADVSTRAGNIDADGVLAKRFEAETDAGEVEVSFAGEPDQVRAKTGVGDVTVYVPKGSYDVEASTGVGDRKVEVPDDPASPRKITLTTNAGNAQVLETS